MLHQVMHDAGFALLSDEGDDTRRFIVEQYNKIQTRLAEIDRDLGARFEPLPGKASPGTVRIAARDMAGFLIDYLRNNRSWTSMALVPGFAWLFSGIEQNG